MNKNTEKTIEEISKKIERPGIIKTLILSIILVLIVGPLFIKYNIWIALHLSFLTWSFFVLCLPVARGKILIGKPYFYITKKQLKYPEAFSWIIALTGNMLTLAISSNPYWKTTITNLLYLIMQKPWPLWLVIIACGFATFFDSYLCNYTQHRISRKLKVLCRLFIAGSFLTTFLLTYNELILVITAPTFQ
ncbi:hypothetical protein KAW80_03965 [Candidatus Babeliales bacterium]|nr:hypothetical protein [Candidatus Babeliales bacterium]